MCGVTAILSGTRKHAPLELRSHVAAMARALAHRGPDGMGVWSDPGCEFAFGHRRLSILDQTSAGSQPMTSPSGR
jgi:asparagine synthase (glutamine-hydrolysing)